MTLHSEKDIVDSKARFLCFASSTMLKPKDIHGDTDSLPMAGVSSLAAALYEFDNKLPTILAGQFAKAKLIHEQTKTFPFMFVQLEDGRYISPFIVRRHILDPVDNLLTMRSAAAMFRRILAEALHDRTLTYAIERPYDADFTYDRMIEKLPDNVTTHKELRP